jgi:Ser/Thr protein kinase RdoA (MazF antagonist)
LKVLKEFPLAPRLLDQFSDKAGHAGMLMTCLPGENIRSARACSPRLAGQIGEALATMQAAVMPELKGEPPAGDWWGAMTDSVLGALARCRAHEAHRDWDAVEKVFLPALARLPKVKSLKFAHFDFRLGNLLQSDGELSGVVDFESSRNGSPDFDLAEICLRAWERSPSLKRAMLRGYGRIRPVPAHLEQTIPIYGLYQSLARVNWCLKRNDTKGSFYISNRRAIRSFVLKLKVKK